VGADLERAGIGDVEIVRDQDAPAPVD